MKKIVLLSLIVVMLAPLAHVVPVQAANFRPNRIMDDVLFDSYNSMSAVDINNFLNQFPYSCISPNSGFQARIPSGYSPSGGYTYGEYGSAGEVIATAAYVFQVNPKVLLTTLEKEQSLVTGRYSASYCTPSDDNNHKYAAAVGYGCPDSATKYNYSGLELYRRSGVIQSTVGPTCVNTASKAGFSQQIIRGAWLLKFGEQRSKGNVGWAVIQGSWNNSDDPQTCYDGPMTEGNFNRCPGGSPSFQDGYRTIDGTAVHIDTGATAALYWYTPHLHGNQSFVTLYTDTFGFGNTAVGCGGGETRMPQVVSMYNPRTYDHHYTNYACEAEVLGFEHGYRYEGAVFNTTAISPAGVPVWRLYNPSQGLHLWTTSQADIDNAKTLGYVQEGIAFYAAAGNAPNVHPVYRLYNPVTYQHVWDLAPGNAATQQAGFRVEGPAFYSQ